jgi:hypothetical protein
MATRAELYREKAEMCRRRAELVRNDLRKRTDGVSSPSSG